MWRGSTRYAVGCAALLEPERPGPKSTTPGPWPAPMTPEQSIGQVGTGLDAGPPARPVAMTATASKARPAVHVVVDHLISASETASPSTTCPSRLVRRGLRLPRTQRGGQNDDGADAGHADRTDLRFGDGGRHPFSPENGPAIRQRISIMPSPPVSTSASRWRRTSNASPSSTSCPTPHSHRARPPGGRPGLTGPTICAVRSPKASDSGWRWPERLLSDPAVLFFDEPTVRARPSRHQRGPRAHRGPQGPRRDDLLTTHRLEEAERLCHRVAILNTTLRLIGRPDELREQLFTKSLEVRTRAPSTIPVDCSEDSRVWRDGS